jgi:hypothetical protein
MTNSSSKKVGKRISPLYPPLEKGGWGDLKAISYIPNKKIRNSKRNRFGHSKLVLRDYFGFGI